jgi:hypothetical protein
MSGREIDTVGQPGGRDGRAQAPAVPAVRLGTTASVASAPSTARRVAVVVSTSAMGFMELSVVLISINLNHELGIPIR